VKCFPQAPGLQPPAEERKTDRETSLHAASGKAKRAIFAAFLGIEMCS